MYVCIYMNAIANCVITPFADRIDTIVIGLVHE